MKTADQRAREAIDQAKTLLLRYRPDLALDVLTKAAEQMLGRTNCDNCGTPITGVPVTDPNTTAWRGAGLPQFCTQACLDAADNRRINKAGTS
jgi:hypothetical protein